MAAFKFEKLVRDKVKDLLEEKGIAVKAQALDEATYQEIIKDKLKEEVNELIAVNSPEKMMEEIADIFEVLEAYIAAFHLDSQLIKRIKYKKHDDRGGFYKRIFIQSIALANDHPDIDIFLADPAHYPLLGEED